MLIAEVGSEISNPSPPSPFTGENKKIGRKHPKNTVLGPFFYGFLVLTILTICTFFLTNLTILTILTISTIVDNYDNC